MNRQKDLQEAISNAAQLKAVMSLPGWQIVQKAFDTIKVQLADIRSYRKQISTENGNKSLNKVEQAEVEAGLATLNYLEEIEGIFNQIISAGEQAGRELTDIKKTQQGG